MVIEDKRGFDALARSGQLVRDNWWRVFGIVIVTQLLAAIPAILISLPFSAIAESADREVIALVGEMAAGVVTTLLVAIVTTLLFYDLKVAARGTPRRARLAGAPVLLAEHQLVRQRRARRR